MNLKIKQSEKIVIIGMSGSGKTTLGKWLIKNLKMKNKIIIDPVGQFIQSPKVAGYLGTWEKIPVFKVFSTEALNVFLSKIFAKDPFFLFLDEADQYIPAHYITITNYTFIFRYLKEGRNFNEGGILIAQLLSQLNKQAFTNSQWLIFFKLNNRSSLDYLHSMLPFDVYKLDSELKKYEFYLINLAESELLGKYRLDLRFNQIMRIS